MTFVPQLAQPGQLGDLLAYVADPAWGASQKVDGRRLAAVVDNGNVTFLNRSGEPADGPPAVAAELGRLRGRCTFDGELLAPGVWWLFDMPSAGDIVTPATPYKTRRERLAGLFTQWDPGPSIRLLPAVDSHAAKTDLAVRAFKARCEGLIFNRLEGPYRPGRRSRDIIKVKFTKQIDCFVSDLRQDGKDNLVVSVFDDGGRRIDFHVTALAGDGPTLQVGDVCTLDYLYASADGRLVQPTMPVRRTDKTPAECLASQLTPTSKAVLEAAG